MDDPNETIDGPFVNISPSAEQYLIDLLSKQDGDDTGVRIFITDPGTPMAETCIAYCRPEEVQDTDQPYSYNGFTAWIDGPSIAYLAESEVDFAEDKMGGQLTIKAPNSKVPRVSDDSPLEEKINYILQSEVNPSLASHGGMVSLVELVDEDVAVLQFGGGCQGCGMVDVTLKDGVEKTLLEQLPQLREVRDITDHTQGENPYY
ncbi:MAG: Fe/S biogenesis protein NfuA [Gammaproteobacteria bacterium]|nr:Fe/S biogenesis protein NfuA [Gammaproteobacteria bacterium]RPG25073.1 MAG: Fe/S biogenesis protein NfuA [Gammaproteobacteria bacterium TMED50]|tara:strand:- start:14420 stop:15031 length:612 start_codon:yes stop_codon:yes gene_type:complete